MDFDKKIDNLIDEIESERDWRAKEFQIIKDMYFSIREDKKERFYSTYSMMCIPMIYAHWEGFCATLFRHITNFLNGLNLKPDQVTIKLFTFAQSKTYDYLKGKHSFEQKCKFSTKFMDLQKKNVKLNKKFDTKSNLKFDPLSDMLDLFDIEHSSLQKYKAKLDRLVEIRNNIAHGENSIIVDDEMLYFYSGFIIELIDEIIVKFDLFLRNKQFLNSTKA
ncbi:MAE_28990/MAE_18760 family HEPN-like nuclease [Desulfobacterales bacterium HSG16]|nr:MAE_28990/MAE_18760 family HEPN-like nuclease [Desulfobacterales bacterium HSG16]